MSVSPPAPTLVIGRAPCGRGIVDVSLEVEAESLSFTKIAKNLLTMNYESVLLKFQRHATINPLFFSQVRELG